MTTSLPSTSAPRPTLTHGPPRWQHERCGYERVGFDDHDDDSGDGRRRSEVLAGDHGLRGPGYWQGDYLRFDLRTRVQRGSWLGRVDNG